MIWNQSFSNTEYWFIGFFIFFYVLYLLRVVFIARKLKTSVRSIIFKIILRTSYFSLILMSVLAPSFGDEKTSVKASGKDIFFLVDISNSMNAKDLQPSRLEKVKFELLKTIQKFQNQRMGLIVFSKDAFVLSPLTSDVESLKFYISQLQTNIQPSFGTDIFNALQLAFNKLTLIEENRNNAKIIVLITDGENHGDFNNELVQQIRNNNINLLIAGIGRRKGANIILSNKIPQHTQLDRESLQKIAQKSQAKYIELNEALHDFEPLNTEIENISEGNADSKMLKIQSNRYMYFLIFALFLLFLDNVFKLTTFRL